MRGSFMLFLLVFLAIIGSAAFYMASRTAFVFGCGRWWIFAGYFILAFVSLAAMMVVRKLYPTLHPFLVILSTLVGVLLYMLIILLLTDAINIFAHFSPKKYGLIVGVFTILISVYGILNTSFPRLKTVEIDIPKLTKPVQIAQLSDVHIGHFRGERNLRRLVQIVNKTEAQMVVITGDMFESFYNLNHETLRPLADLKVPVFFVSGNHDMYVDVDSVKQLMRDAGVNVLENSMMECCNIQIVGLDYMRPDDHAPDRRETGNPPRRHFVPEPALEGPRGGVCFRPPRPPALARTPSRCLGRRRHRGRGRERTSGCGAGGRRTPPRTGIDRHHLPPRGARRGAAHHRRHRDGGAHPDPHIGRVRPRAWRVFRI